MSDGVSLADPCPVGRFESLNNDFEPHDSSDGAGIRARMGAFVPRLSQTPPFYGVAHYTGYMPDERLDKDVELMRQAGITVVRLGESSWGLCEPEEGKFDWLQNRQLNFRGSVEPGRASRGGVGRQIVRPASRRVRYC